MSLKNYLVKSNESYLEILWDFRPEQVEELYKLLLKKGHVEYHTFCGKNIQDIHTYIGLSPSQRRQKKWVNRPDALEFRFAALQAAHSAVAFLDRMLAAADLVDGGSYRKFLEETSRALYCKEVQFPFYAIWPFDQLKNPFL